MVSRIPPAIYYIESKWVERKGVEPNKGGQNFSAQGF